MGFIMGKKLNRLGFVVFLFAYGNLFAKDVDLYMKHVKEIIRNFSRDMEREFGLVCIGDGGSLAYDVYELKICFNAYQRATIEQACELEVKVTEKFLEAINNHSKIRPYLREYPFTVPRAEVSISFKKPNGRPYTDGIVVGYVYQVRGYIFYCKRDEQGRFQDLGEEPYEAALRIVQNQDLHLQHDFSEKWGKLKNWKSDPIAAQEDEKFLERYTLQTPFQRWERLKEIAENNSRMTLSGGIRELITGVSDSSFEDTLQKIEEREKKQFDGEYVEYWDNGQMKVKGAIKNGFADGHIHGWYKNGYDAFKAFFHEGLKQGVHMAFFPVKNTCSPETNQGRILSYNEEGKAYGRQETSYPKSNALEAIMRFKDGLIDGEASLYAERPNGLIEKRKYELGKLIYQTQVPLVEKDRSNKTGKQKKELIEGLR
jgi:antitoxin component YwqK of YwqJK toxin-antitoxin module